MTEEIQLSQDSVKTCCASDPLWVEQTKSDSNPIGGAEGVYSTHLTQGRHKTSKMVKKRIIPHSGNLGEFHVNENNAWRKFYVDKISMWRGQQR